MKIGIVKPDYKIIGGFEIVVARLKAELESLGHEVEMVYVDATSQILNDIPYHVDHYFHSRNPDFFRYINSFWKYLKMNMDKYDLVISTQPPSFAIEHERHISLFYHHLKIYYDLSALIQEVGLQQPSHRKAVEIVREIDTISLAKVSTILAGSKTVKERIHRYNNLAHNIDVIYAGIDPDIYDFDGRVTYKVPIVVGRHEFPKRPELFVAAMKKVQGMMGKVVGVGGRTEDLKKIDTILSYANYAEMHISDEAVWKKMSLGNFSPFDETLWQKAKKSNVKSNLLFTGKVSKDQLFKEYAEALCVVCPAYEEDYGLTAIEAMAFKKPVIACKDGGGYTELIEDGVNGFIVEPSSDAIAKAIQQLKDNPGLAERMGKAAYETSRKYTWKNTTRKMVEYL